MTFTNSKRAPETFDARRHYPPGPVRLPFYNADGSVTVDTVAATVARDDRDPTLVAVRTRTDWNLATWIRWPGRVS